MGEKIGTEKELQAVMYNIKEQRLLEKALGTLSLEESYSVKLINLDHKTIKVRQRRLKKKVSKIKSYLSADEIAELKLSGIDEQLAPREGAVSNGAVRIAGAAKRLKLGVLPRSLQRSSAFSRPSTARGTVSESSGEEGGERQPDRMLRRPRPATSMGLATRKPSAKVNSTPSLRPKTAPGPKGQPKTTDIDDILNPEKRKLNSAMSNRRGSSYSSSSFGEELRRAKAFERRQELLEQMAERQEGTKERCQEFLVKANRWVRENPAISYRPEGGGRQEGDSEETPRRPPSGNSRVADIRPSGFNSHARRNSKPLDTASTWKDLNKCRYLRMDSDQIDLSGINTLAKDQLRMTSLFRQSESSQITNGPV